MASSNIPALVAGGWLKKKKRRKGRWKKKVTGKRSKPKKSEYDEKKKTGRGSFWDTSFGAYAN